MDLTLTEEQALIQETARRFLDANAGVRIGGASVAGEEPGCSPGLWPELVELGWPGLAVPEAYGGVGRGFLESCLLFEELGAALVPSPLLVTIACAAMPILRFGTAAQRSLWLGRIAAGRTAAYVRAAPRAHWGADGSTVTATLRGHGFVLNGTAGFVPFGGTADGLVVAADTGAGLTVFLVGPGRPAGIAAESLPVIGPNPYHRVCFDHVEVPHEAALGPVHGGRDVVRVIEAFGTAATCAEMVGGARRVLDRTVEYAGRRRQFGRPIGSFQAVHQHCADMATDTLGARLIAYEAIWRLAADPAGDGTALTVSAAKSWVSEAYQRVCARGHQVHGAIGFTAEHDLHRYSRHALSASLAFGDADVHTGRVADALGLPR
ncbi:acyl-CoA dehydrogenase family protein [Amycolatopsis saalfeldensis]|uniref:Acyl-CoA dehydrogenase n=1 Tax=Amycolatopsis saalfeldensis TaxID=394193 RepID=A0A1H8YK04_9PSEU|nr:acyl-CoA dehydrogenase family protein [Amycolatopsis saalfeldensis]SEP52392.1 Acyl-CoA dehydrogenase [Amycolatopsis saalfeldensis]